jgi:hypothetical protein
MILNSACAVLLVASVIGVAIRASLMWSLFYAGVVIIGILIGVLIGGSIEGL